MSDKETNAISYPGAKGSVDMSLNAHEQKAIFVLKTRLEAQFGNVRIVLFGSKARGDADVESDIDLLILTDRIVDTALELAVFRIGFEIELAYDVILGLIVMNSAYWDSTGRQMPLRWNIDREGIAV